VRRPVAVLAAAAGLAGAAGACGGGAGSGGADGAPGTRPAAAARCPEAGPSAVPGGVLRVPARARAGATPLLVVVVPGGLGDPLDVLGIARAATRAGVAVLHPVSRNGGFWTLNDRQGRADVEDVSGLLDRVQRGGCFDPRRISITGVSNGAGFAVRMACEEPGRFAALVLVAAGYRALDPCPDAARTSFLAIHGTGDTVVPYDGRPPARRGSAPRQAAAWAARGGCTSRQATTPRPLVSRYRWQGCAGGVRVELLRLRRTAHGWPSAGGDGNPSRVDATEEVLRFIAPARVAGPR
jgi:polyhydroxybutyrate depolymerase